MVIAKFSCVLLLLSVATCSLSCNGASPGIAKTQSDATSAEVVVNKKNKYNGGGGGGGGGYGGRGWGWGGGGGGYWGWGCRRPRKNKTGRERGNWKNHVPKKRVFNSGDYKLGEFAQCMVVGRCRGMRLDCPLHCGGPCLYDCINMCKAHCRRP